MTFAFLGVAAMGCILAWFGWVCEHAPIVETELERRWREDREVAALDAIWVAPAFDGFRAGEYLDRLSRMALED